MTCILGIDPGSLVTGYGLIDVVGSQSRYRDCGCIQTPGDRPLGERLKTIFESVTAVIAQHRPEEIAVEQVFMHRNPDSALKLGQARGVAICAAAMAGYPVSEYTPRLVKQAVVGTGAADKAQVQHMVCALLKLDARPPADAADALAIALCHGHTMQTLRRLGGVVGALRRRR